MKGVAHAPSVIVPSTSVKIAPVRRRPPSDAGAPAHFCAQRWAVGSKSRLSKNLVAGQRYLRSTEFVQFDATDYCTTTCERNRWTYGPSTQQRSWLESTL